MTVNLVPEMNIKMDIPTVLNSVDFEDTYDGDFQTRRALIWHLNFTMKGYLYGPVANQGVIKRIAVDIYEDDENFTFLQSLGYIND